MGAVHLQFSYIVNTPQKEKCYSFLSFFSQKYSKARHRVFVLKLEQIVIRVLDSFVEFLRQRQIFNLYSTVICDTVFNA